MEKDNLARVREVANTYAITKPFDELEGYGRATQAAKPTYRSRSFISRGKGGSGRSLAV